MERNYWSSCSGKGGRHAAEFTANNRKRNYERFCALGTHPSPIGFGMLKKSDFIPVGPFFDSGLIRGGLEELVIWFPYAALKLNVFFGPLPKQTHTKQLTFFNEIYKWFMKYNGKSEQILENDDIQSLKDIVKNK